MSEPEGQCSDFSSFSPEEFSSNSDFDSEELSLSINKNKNCSENIKKRKFSTDSTTTTFDYRSSNSPNVTKKSNDSLTSLTGVDKNWWYWMKLAVFISTPFIARQLGIFVGKRFLVKSFQEY